MCRGMNGRVTMNKSDRREKERGIDTIPGVKQASKGIMGVYFGAAQQRGKHDWP